MGSEGIVYRRPRLCVLPCSPASGLCVQRGHLELPWAGDVCPGPLQLLRYVHTSSVPAPWVNLRFIKRVPPANPLCFKGGLQVSRRRLLL